MDQTRRRRVTGYSLVELLFAMVVFGVLLTITYLKAEPALEHARVRGAAGILAHAVADVLREAAGIRGVERSRAGELATRARLLRAKRGALFVPNHRPACGR